MTKSVDNLKPIIALRSHISHMWDSRAVFIFSPVPILVVGNQIRDVMVLQCACIVLVLS